MVRGCRLCLLAQRDLAVGWYGLCIVLLISIVVLINNSIPSGLRQNMFTVRVCGVWSAHTRSVSELPYSFIITV